MRVKTQNPDMYKWLDVREIQQISRKSGVAVGGGWSGVEMKKY